MKNIFRIIAFTLILSLLMPGSVFCDTVDSIVAESVVGSWYGQYTGNHNDIYVERYMNMTIESIDDNGNFTEVAYVPTVEGQGYDYEYFNYKFEGKFDFSTNEFFMQGTKLMEHNSSTNWTMIPFDGSLYYTDSGELNVSGIADNNPEKEFLFARVSDWAKQEVTDANARGLIPESIKGKDLSKPITRAEFAAVSVQLYETLTGEEAEIVSIPFIDTLGSIDEDYIKKAYGLNIAIGTSDKLFEPDIAINREQLVTMLCRTIKKFKYDEWTIDTDSQYILDYSGVTKFADDENISDFAKPSVYYMVKMGIISGIDTTHFAPKNYTDEQEAEGYATATREQAIALSLRIYNASDNF
ncbi:MAG: S-layer homology domain-containing protein [Clostridiales bacterium]|nr:S-layer homology domain-containing protein [Clostridiales bacterium]